MLRDKADCARLSAVHDENAFDKGLNAAILKLHNTQLIAANHPN